jgi:hypothetical protein
MDLEDAAGQSGSDDLPHELARLERRLASGDATRGRVIDELARVRHDLVRGGDRAPGLRLVDLRIASPCKQSWADMGGDDRVRACRGCDRPVFNLSEMTRAQAEAVLATRGVTPCVRFYRRADGTVMTSDCPTGTRHDGRRLTMVASTLATGAALAGASPVRADPDPAQATAEPPAPGTDTATPPDPAADPGPPDPAPTELIPVDRRHIVDMWMGIPPPRDKPPRATLEWSTWTRLGAMGKALAALP